LPPPETADLIHQLFARFDQIVAGKPWYAGDHGLFLMHQRPALAFTSAELTELMAIIHTEADRPEIIDAGQLVAVATALHELLLALAQGNGGNEGGKSTGDQLILVA
jgi:hypothetical protein